MALINIDKGSSTPLYVQLTEQVRLLIHEGALEAGDAMPTVRGLAVELGINANTVARVYRDLQAEGWLVLQRGVGSFVSDGADAPLSSGDFAQIESYVDQLIDIAQRVGLKRHEMSQMIESRWNEV